MARYINADILLDKLYEHEFITLCPLDEVSDVIDYCPTVDAEPVRHGRWIYKYFDAYCSNCGWENKADTVTRIRNDYPYCPHCGAKMDEGVR